MSAVMTRKLRFVLRELIPAALILMVLGAAQVAVADDNIRFQRLSLEQGLSQEAVHAIFQDHRGYMWFGTQEGLNRFDGYQFKAFNHDYRDKTSIGNGWVYAITESTAGELWVGTGAGVSVLNTERTAFRHYRANGSDNSLSSKDVRVLYKDSTGQLWLGTDAGLNRYNPVNDNFEKVSLTGTDNPKIWSITEDAEGKLWVGTDGQGMVRLDPASGEVDMTFAQLQQKIDLDSKRIKALLVDNQNHLWIGTRDQGVLVVHLQDYSQQWFKQGAKSPYSISHNTVRHIFQDNSGSVWISTIHGLNKISSANVPARVLLNEANNEYSLSSNDVITAYQDRGGVFWVGTHSGLNKWNTATAKFEHFRVKINATDSLSGNGVNAIFESTSDVTWVGTYSGLNRIDNTTGEITHFRHDPNDPSTISSDRIMSLYARHADELWIGTQRAGMSKLDTRTGEFTHYRPNPNDKNSIGAKGVTDIHPASDGKLWVATFGGGLNLFDPENETFLHFKHNPARQDSLSSNKVMSVMQDSRGLLWVGTWGGGLNLFNPSTLSVIRVQNDPENSKSLASDEVWGVLEDRQNNMWISTQGGGLHKLSARNRGLGKFEFEVIDRSTGLVSNVVYGALQDNQNNIWMSTNRGLSKYSPDSKTLLNYDSSHGLQGNEFNSGAFFKNGQDRFFFGGSNGLTAFYPHDILPNSHVPPVVLTRFLKLNKSISPVEAMSHSESIQVSHHDYLIAFEFAGLDYASPSNNQYRYKLEGFDEDWIEAGDLRRATYTNLPAGQYVFKATASNNDGVWNEQGTTMALTVLPSPWLSWWAYTIYWLLAALVLLLLFRSYLNKQRKEANYRIELEAKVEQRTSELQTLNSQLLNASLTDQLTGLHNRRFLSNVVEQESARVLREFENHGKNQKMDVESGPRLFFLMFDLDGFKPVNDTHGHDAGDKVICQVSQVLKSVCRKSDTVIRWGGDEFLIMGRVEKMREIHQLAERLREKVAEHGFDIGISQRLHLSCSIGYSVYPFSHHYPDALGWEQVQLIADRALYHSKDQGRNQWSGIVATDKKIPFGLMNNLTQNLEQMLKEGYASVTEPSMLDMADVQFINERL